MSYFKVFLASQLVMMFLEIFCDLSHTFVRNPMRCEHPLDVVLVPVFEWTTYNTTHTRLSL